MRDPRPLAGEPLPLDLLNTVWIDDGQRFDLLTDEAGTRAWLDAHDLDGPADAAARKTLRETRDVLRALVADRSSDDAREGVNAVLARGGRRPVLRPDGTTGSEVDAAAAWRVPWRCAAELVALLDTRGARVRPCANPECVLWFLDVSRPGTRRWCSMAGCGNRDKAMRHGRVRTA